VARKTHRSSDEEHQEDPRPRLTLFLDLEMRRFLDVEAKRLSVKYDRRIRPADVAKALITSYYEKRLAGLLVDPDD